MRKGDNQPRACSDCMPCICVKHVRPQTFHQNGNIIYTEKVDFFDASKELTYERRERKFMFVCVNTAYDVIISNSREVHLPQPPAGAHDVKIESIPKHTEGNLADFCLSILHRCSIRSLPLAIVQHKQLSSG